MSYHPMRGTENYMSLFTQKPNLYILKKVLECFEITNLNDNKIISRIHTDIIKLNQKMTNLIPDLSLYYHIRLINKYFYENDISFIKCISILRNIIYQLDYILLKIEVIINKKKVIQYKIANKKDYYNNIHKKIRINRSESILCSFD